VANATSPVTVSGLTHVTQLAGGEGEAYALDNNHRVWSWGINTTASLGLGSFGHRRPRSCRPRSGCCRRR